MLENIEITLRQSVTTVPVSELYSRFSFWVEAKRWRKKKREQRNSVRDAIV